MAQIDLSRFKSVTKERNTIQKKVSAAYCTFEMNGEKYFQIDTMGNDDREIPGKISQSIQLDKESALFLIKLLTKEFL